MRLLITTLFLSSFFSINASSLSSMNSDTLISNGKLVKKPFVNKIGKEFKNTNEYYFKCDEQLFFIKLNESQISKADLEKYFEKENTILKYSVMDGMWDSNGETEIQSRVGKYIHIHEIMKNIKLEYADGSGNLYIIHYDHIEYLPIKPENSSSGIYDGGEATKKNISYKEFKQIEDEFNLIFKNKSIQINGRMMGSGMLSIIEDGYFSQTIISPSNEQKRLELLLKKFLKME
jgi:hypothetical protein